MHSPSAAGCGGVRWRQSRAGSAPGTTMRRPLTAAAVWLAIATTSAIAAEPPMLPPPRLPLFVPFFTWNGPYIGANFGYGWGTSSWNDTGALASTGSFAVSGGQAGVTLGYNFQTFGLLVLGLETDLDWSGLR